MQDAQNLAWKLALVLRKQADSALLATYEGERRPVVLFTTEQTRLGWQAKAQRHAGDAAQREKPGLANEAVVMLGYQYTTGALISPRRELPSLSDVSQNLDGHLGTYAPHRWIEHQGRLISTQDLYGRGFVLLTGMRAASWYAATRHVSSRFGLDLTAYTVGLDFADAEERGISMFKKERTREKLHHDCSDENVAYALSRLCPESAAISITPLTLMAERFGHVARLHRSLARSQSQTSTTENHVYSTVLSKGLFAGNESLSIFLSPRGVSDASYRCDYPRSSRPGCLEMKKNLPSGCSSLVASPLNI